MKMKNEKLKYRIDENNENKKVKNKLKIKIKNTPQKTLKK